MPSRARTRLVDAIKEVFADDPGPLHWSEVAKRIDRRHPGAFKLNPSTVQDKLNTLAAADGFLTKPRGDTGYFQRLRP